MSALVVARSMPTSSSGLEARVFERADGAPLRPVVRSGGRRKPARKYRSQKNGCTMPWTHRAELSAFYRAEVDADVISYRAQPHRLQLTKDGQHYQYTPNIELRRANGLVEILEVRPKIRFEEAGDYAVKLTYAAEAYCAFGWRFSVIDRSVVEAEPQFSAAETIQAYRNTVVSPHDILCIKRLGQIGKIQSLGSVKAAFGNPIVGMVKAYAMAARRLIDIELTDGLHDGALVRILGEGQDD